MRYEVVHTTEYEYSEAVAVSHHIARLRPRTLPEQRCFRHELEIDPTPAVTSTYEDYFGNGVTFFAMQGSHKRLTIRARTTVDVAAREPPEPSRTVAWETAADQSRLPLEAVEFVFSGGVIAPPGLDAYTSPSFPPGRPLLEAVIDLTRRIHDEFTFDRKATTIATPLAEVFRSRRGVCQDFARLEIACLRSRGVAARYVSGYLETLPPPGRPRLLGADASHAWLDVYCPPAGWVHVDPTNNLLPSGTHVTLAWGRDYGDISPLHGVILGGGQHSLAVHVDVIRPNSADATNHA
jgi:transglutaminase-like putative cysteine protease